MLRQVPVGELAHRCREETLRFVRGEARDDAYCFELFERAVVHRDDEAWAAIVTQYRGVVLAYLNQHEAAALMGESDDYWINHALQHFRRAVDAERFSQFPDLSALLNYLKLCVHSALIDEVRARRAGTSAPRDAPALYRIDCPPPQALGEYEVDVLSPDRRTQTAAHIGECEECRVELTALRAFLSQPSDMPESVFARARRLVTSLMAPAPRLRHGGLDGQEQPPVRVYEIEDVTITVATREGSGSLIGLVMVTSSPPELLVGRQIRLVPPVGPPLFAGLDDIGNFEFARVATGEYVLELDLPDSVIVIEALRVD